MAAGELVALDTTGKFGVLSSGKLALMDSSNECAACCGADIVTVPCSDCPDDVLSQYYRVDFANAFVGDLCTTAQCNNVLEDASFVVGPIPDDDCEHTVEIGDFPCGGVTATWSVSISFKLVANSVTVLFGVSGAFGSSAAEEWIAGIPDAPVGCLFTDLELHWAVRTPGLTPACKGEGVTVTVSAIPPP